MKKSILILALTCISLISNAQVWYFGNHAGLVFNNNPLPASISGNFTNHPAINTFEGSTVVNDANNHVMFYTDGTDLYDGNDILVTIPGATGGKLIGSSSATHAAIAVPIPGTDCKKYLIFTTKGFDNAPTENCPLGLCLVTTSDKEFPCTVTAGPAERMILGDGNSFNFSEKLAVTDDGSDGFWVVAHDWAPFGSTDAGATFYVFHITAALLSAVTTTHEAKGILENQWKNNVYGAQSNPLWANHNETVPFPPTGNGGNDGNHSGCGQGQMKFSKLGNKLGLVIAGKKIWENYSFNKLTGILTLQITHTLNNDSTGSLYGCEFSPNGNLFYTAEDVVWGDIDVSMYREIKQWNVTGGVLSPIHHVVDKDNYHRHTFGAMQLGPDDKIYYTGPDTPLSFVSVINYPDIYGFGCGRQRAAVTFLSAVVNGGLPTLIKNMAGCDPANSKIVGVKFNDKNGDGDWDYPDEKGLSGWTINLTCPNGTTQSKTTVADGSYEFDNLTPGNYNVQEVEKECWRQTTPGIFGHNIDLPANSSSIALNFGNQCIRKVHGIKFCDLNGNGIRDEGEWVLQNFKIIITNSEGGIDSIRTDANGYYEFKISCGALGYYISEEKVPLWIQTKPLLPKYYTIKPSDCPNSISYDFGNMPLYMLGPIDTCAELEISTEYMNNWWKLDEEKGNIAYDHAGDQSQPNDGLYSSSPPQKLAAGFADALVFGKVQGALRFSSTDQNVVVQSNTDVNFGTGNFTFDAWIRLVMPTIGSYNILNKMDGNTGYYFYVDNSGVLSLRIGDGNPYKSYYCQGATLSLAIEWYHVGVSVNRNTNTVLFYVNGYEYPSQGGSPPVPQGTLNNAVSLKIGGISVDSYFEDLDEIETFTHVVPLSQFKELFRARKAGKCHTYYWTTIHELMSPRCNNSSDGRIKVDVVSYKMQSPFTFIWSTGDTTSEITGLHAGIYTVTVSDVNGNSDTNSYELINPPLLTITPTVTPVACNDPGSGQINLNVEGGTPPYTYLWITGNTTQYISGLIAGNYSVLVTDVNGCTQTASQTVIEDQPTPPPTGNTNQSFCSSVAPTLADLVTTGASIKWYSSLIGGVSLSPSTNLSDNTHYYASQTVNGCESSDRLDVKVTIDPVIQYEETVVACDSYSWSANGYTYTVSGDYTYQVPNSCVVYTLHLTIIQTSTVQETTTACDNYTWYGQNYTTSGNYSYFDDANCVLHILHLTIDPAAVVEETVSVCDVYTWSINGYTYIVSGDYSYIAPNSCVKYIMHLTISLPLIATCSSTNVSCNSENDGTATVSIIGGTSPYHCSWSNNTSYSWSTGDPVIYLVGLSAGTYCVTVTDKNNCTATCCVTINPSPELCSGNILQNGGFNNVQYVGSSDLDYGSTVAGWHRVTESPQVFQYNGCCSSEGWVQMWGNSTISESIEQTGVNILQGHHYKIHFCAQFGTGHPLPADQFVQFMFRASNNQLFDQSCSSGCSLIGKSAQITNTGWNEYEIPCWTADADYSHFTVSVFTSQIMNDGNYVTNGHIDNICVVECCDANISGPGPVTKVSDITVCEGATVADIPLTVTSFNNVGSISLKLTYDPTKLGQASLLSQYVGLDAWGSDLTVNTSAPGLINIVGMGTGITMIDNQTLFTFRFTKATPITDGVLAFNEGGQGTFCEYAPDTPPSYTPFCDMPTASYYINGGVTVNDVTSGTIGSDQTICYGGDPVLLSSGANGSGDGTLSYIWESSGSPFIFWTVIGGANSATYDPPAGLSATTKYRRTTISTLNGSVCLSVPTNVVTITVNDLQTISGYFTYYNLANTPLTGQDITVKLYRAIDNALMGTTITNSSGYYQFTNICPATNYYIVATSTHSTVGSVNGTDASQVNYWAVNPYNIEKVRFYAGDVNGNNFINASDARSIQYNFVYGYPFVRPPWTFWRAGETISGNTNPSESYPTVTLGVGSNLTANMYGLCTGDFNRSFDPSSAKSISTTLNLINSGNLLLSNNQEFDLPVRIVNASNVGAVSLILNFPANLVEVEDVIMNDNSGQLDWNVNGNELRIGWNSLSPLILSDNAVLLTLKLKTTSAFISGENIQFSLAANPLNELADDQYNVIDGALLSVDVINSAATGVEEQSIENVFTLNSYPNPFNGTTLINYNLPFSGKVKLEIFNYIGSRVTLLADEDQLKGNHSIKLQDATLAAGVYTVTITVKNENNRLARSIRILNIR